MSDNLDDSGSYCSLRLLAAFDALLRSKACTKTRALAALISGLSEAQSGARDFTAASLQTGRQHHECVKGRAQ